MHKGWLVSLGVLLLTSTLARAQTQRIEFTANRSSAVGYLVPPPVLSGALVEPRPVPYQPQPGDIVLYDDFNKLFHLAFKLANTAPPTHVAIVIAAADGKPALLEMTGPRTILATVKILDPETRLRSYPGEIMVRRLREPLTAEQSRELTEFAYAQKDKRFAFGRVALLVTPFCPRTGLRHTLFGHTYLNRNRWFCSELVVAACTKAQVLSAKTCSANATYPRDLAADDRINLSHLYHPPVPWSGALKR